MNRWGGVAFLAVILVGCSSNQTEPQVAQTANVSITYWQGFFPLERNSAGSWRWMGPKGALLLTNTHRPMVLSIRGSVPIQRLSEPPVLTIQLNGQMLDEWTESNETIEREYTISPEQQGSANRSELRIASSRSYVPQEIDPQSPDRRRLAMIISSVAWEPQ